MDKDKPQIMKKKIIKNDGINKIFLFILLTIIIISIFFIYFLRKPKGNEKIVIGNFSFDGLKYNIEFYGKTNYGKELIFYHSRIFFPKRNITYNLYLRYDPRKNNVPINITNLKEIKATTYLAFDRDFDNVKCDELSLAGYRLGEFLFVLGVNKEVAIYFENYSLPTYRNYIVIKNYNFSEKHNVTVILIKYGREEKVYNINNTIVIQSNNCKILKSTEKFILYIIKKLKKLNGVVPI